MKIKNNKQRGFTLVELIVVIVIIAILAAISVASYSKNIGKARKNTCKHNRETICEALRIRSSADGGLSVESIEEELDRMGYHIDSESKLGITYGDICSANGNISIVIDKNIITLECDIHTNEDDLIRFIDSVDVVVGDN